MSEHIEFTSEDSAVSAKIVYSPEPERLTVRKQYYPTFRISDDEYNWYIDLEIKK